MEVLQWITKLCIECIDRKVSMMLLTTHVTKTLRNAISKGKQSHAYIFSGPRGTGKTSIAKVFAKAINCLNSDDGEPCNE